MRSTLQQRCHAGVLVVLCAILSPPTTLAAGPGDGAELIATTCDGCEPPQDASSRTTTTVILVRHAEKALEGDPEFAAAPPNDPPLNAAGRMRATALARTLGEAEVTAIYASEFARTRQTVAPLAAALTLDVTIHPAGDTSSLVSIVATEHRGGTVVIAGHSNTVPAIIEALGAGPIEPIGEAWEYDNLYVVVIEAQGQARVSTLKYGAPSIR